MVNNQTEEAYRSIRKALPDILRFLSDENVLKELSDQNKRVDFKAVVALISEVLDYEIKNPLIIDYYEKSDRRFISRYGHDTANWPKEVLENE